MDKQCRLGVQTGAVLAGGENRRFPQLKSFIHLDGSPLIERAVLLLKTLFPKIFISTNRPDLYFPLGVPLIGDTLPSVGPMAGIHSSLINATGNAVFVIACDMPFPSRDLISLLCREHSGSLEQASFDATVAMYDGEPQPLFGVYSKSIVPQLETGILGRKTTMKRFLDEIKTQFVEESRVRRIDPLGRSFININTIADYDKIRCLGERLTLGPHLS